MSKYRKKLSRRGSQKYFSATASKTHYKNTITTRPMRGGIRM